jgi:hypothetical protein
VRRCFYHSTSADIKWWYNKAVYCAFTSIPLC